MKFAIAGAGAIGGFIAAALSRAGYDVTVVARGEHAVAIERDGLTLEASDLGPFTVHPRVVRELSDDAGYDLVIAAFKAHQWPAFIPQFQAVARTGASVVTLQNGVPFWFVRTPPLSSVDAGGALGRMFGDERVIGGVVHVSGHIVAPGRVHQSGGTRYMFGRPDGSRDDVLEALVLAMAQAGLTPETPTQIREPLWLKLVNNVGLNAVSAIHHVTIRTMLDDPALRAEVLALMREALAVGKALGVVDEADLEARIVYAQRLGDVKTSMLQDRLAGRALEIDPMHGAVLELARRVDVPTPHVARAYEALRPLSSP